MVIIMSNERGRFVVWQISVNSRVSTASYDKSIQLGRLIQGIMGNIFKIRGNRDMLCVSQERDRSQKPLIGLKILRQKRHGIVTEHASCFFTLEKFNMADALLLFMHGNCNIISL